MSTETEAVSAPEKDESPWFRWWAALQHAKGDRAALRRCRTVLEVSLEPAFHQLLKRSGSRLGEAGRDRVAAAAGILAQVSADAPARSLAALMARPKGDKPVVSDLRFRRLLRLEEPDELLHELVRVVQMLGGEAPVSALGRDLANWGDSVRKKWALDYYEKANLT